MSMQDLRVVRGILGRWNASKQPGFRYGAEYLPVENRHRYPARWYQIAPNGAVSGARWVEKGVPLEEMRDPASWPHPDAVPTVNEVIDRLYPGVRESADVVAGA